MKRIRWGLIGTGDIAAKRVAPAIAETPRSELLAVSRRQADRAEELVGRPLRTLSAGRLLRREEHVGRHAFLHVGDHGKAH